MFFLAPHEVFSQIKEQIWKINKKMRHVIYFFVNLPMENFTENIQCTLL